MLVALAKFFARFIGHAAALISEPASLVIFGICLCLVALAVLRRESVSAMAEQTNEIMTEITKLELFPAVLASAGKSPGCSLPLRGTSSAVATGFPSRNSATAESRPAKSGSRVVLDRVDEPSDAHPSFR